MWGQRCQSSSISRPDQEEEGGAPPVTVREDVSARGAIVVEETEPRLLRSRAELVADVTEEPVTSFFLLALLKDFVKSDLRLRFGVSSASVHGSEAVSFARICCETSGLTLDCIVRQECAWMQQLLPSFP